MSTVRFRMPAEWDRHSATWLSWPHNAEDWPGKFEPIPWVYADIVRQLSAVERVRILVPSDAAHQRAHEILAQTGAHLDNVDFYLHATNRSWTRDFCPVFVRDIQSGAKTILDWHFNGWAKYDNWQLDDASPAIIADLLE